MTATGPLARALAALPPDGVGSFCIVCGAPVRREQANVGGEVFACPNDHYEPRCFLFDGKARWEVVDGRLVHESVGAIVRRGGKTLLFKRTRFPLGWTIPAGHVEVGAEPEAEMRREVREETGLVVTAARRVWPDAPAIEDACRRGADVHHWHLYEVEVEAGDVRLDEEGCEHAWQTDAQIGALGAAGLLVPPVREIFARLGVVAPRPARPGR